MKFTANMDCATEGLEERKDRYDDYVGEDPWVQEALRHVSDKIGCIRNVLIQSQASAEDIALLDELDDMIVEVMTREINVLAEAADKEVFIAYRVGQAYGRLLERRKSNPNASEGSFR